MNSRRKPNWGTLLLALCFSLFAGCRTETYRAPDSGGPPVDAGVPTLQLTLTLSLPDGGTQTLPLVAGERPTVEPSERLAVLVTPALQNFRVRVFDEADRALESTDEAPTEVLTKAPTEALSDGPAGASTTYRMALARPLRAGHKYAVVLDAEAGATLTDSSGRAWSDQRLEFQVAGERERDPPTKPVRRRRRR
ncbi:MAG: hypothetical protein ACKVPX_04470 [Myxococcaceae bacterium]